MIYLSTDQSQCMNSTEDQEQEWKKPHKKKGTCHFFIHKNLCNTFKYFFALTKPALFLILIKSEIVSKLYEFVDVVRDPKTNLWCVKLGRANGIRHLVIPLKSNMELEGWDGPLQENEDYLYCVSRTYRVIINDQLENLTTMKRNQYFLNKNHALMDMACCENVPLSKTAQLVWNKVDQMSREKDKIILEKDKLLEENKLTIHKLQEEKSALLYRLLEDNKNLYNKLLVDNKDLYNKLLEEKDKLNICCWNTLLQMMEKMFKEMNNKSL